MNCPCCSGKSYEECCKPFHTKTKFPQTAEELMRSRFSAFAIPNGEYLMDTTFPAKRKLHNKKDLQEWGEINDWTKLEIVKLPGKIWWNLKRIITTKTELRKSTMKSRFLRN